MNKLARRLNAFDATLIVMGGIVGSGIFMNPSVVAARAHTTALILIAWIFGGLVALAGACIFAELAWRRPDSGGLYGYMRDAYHPVVAFMYGWTALLVSQSGGMAAAAITFAVYFQPLTGLHVTPWMSAVAAIAILSAVNCAGVREGGSTQNVLMVLKAVVIVAVIVAGFVGPHGSAAHAAVATNLHVGGMALFAIVGAALIPVLYSYDGWQTAPFIDGELKDPKRSLPRALIWGVVLVVFLYLAITIAALRMLGPAGLAATATPAADMMRLLVGPVGERIVAAGIALSTLGFLSNQILTSPRIYYAMAKDGLFFKQLAWLHPRTHAPIAAIAIQGVVAIVIALSGRYDQILNYVTAMDFVFFGLAGFALVVFRRRSPETGAGGVRMPGHPWSTMAFVLVSAAVVVNTYVNFPADTLVGLLILFSGVPVYAIWRRRARVRA